MITKKIMLASAALLALAGWSAIQWTATAQAAPDAAAWADGAGATAVGGHAVDQAKAGEVQMVDANSLPQGPALPSAIRSAADVLFSEDAELGDTRALLVLRDGKLVYERYAEGFGPQTKLISWSMAKSITAVLVGILVSDGRLALDGPVPVEAWQNSGDPRGNISLRHLLHMASGLEHRESGDPIWEADTTAMLFGAGSSNMAGFAEGKPAVAVAGEVFNYSTPTSVILSDLIAQTLTPSHNAVTRRDAVLEFVRGRLAQPLGMTSLTPEFDAQGTMIGGSVMHATARDYARFGEFLRNRGVANGQRLLPDAWIDFMLTPSDADAGYGGHIWLNRKRPAGSDAALWPQRGPNDLFAAIGHQGQYIIVSPSQRVTVVRLGVTRDEEFPMLRRRLADLVESL
ncbi:serine hydrolase domain-containing protein [Sphingopyxis yananensis]|uniref:serine hydrolase domain-containing protein n=1 Tax=Sphingopyxis yananensis TaxID=2886687 RepID=UPI001D101568|nr:serine hydrolase [Sphingopyxis yananensis]MCC2602071.1 beta-lactamase family protein [Sphingopyxis yananensis]